MIVKCMLRVSRRFLLLSVFVVLVSSCFVFAFNGVSFFASASSDKVVSTEVELKAVVNNAVGYTVIALDSDIQLTEPLVISANKNIALISNGSVGFFKLIGASGESTLIVDGGTLNLDGIIVTHNKNENGQGIVVTSNGVLSMSDGEISGNKVGVAIGGGGIRVYGSGTFSLSGGKISNNEAFVGGGVYIDGVFTMSGGEISDNYATAGGGVWVAGDFSLSGGKISDNTATRDGGGVYIDVKSGVFKLSGGMISGNVASNGGGGIWVNTDHLCDLFVSDGVVFSNNRASAAYNRNSIHDEVYNSHIGSSVIWTSPFTQGYNNYDISYAIELSFDVSQPSVSPIPSQSSPLSTIPVFLTFSGLLIIIGVVITLVVGIVIVIVFFHFKKGHVTGNRKC